MGLLGITWDYLGLIGIDRDYLGLLGITWDGGCSVQRSAIPSWFQSFVRNVSAALPPQDEEAYKAEFASVLSRALGIPARRVVVTRLVRVVTFSFLCPLLEKHGTFIARCNALIEKVSPCIRLLPAWPFHSTLHLLQVRLPIVP